MSDTKRVYTINGNIGPFWIIEQDGQAVAEVKGSMGLAIAAAAVERLNADPPFFHEGWIHKSIINVTDSATREEFGKDAISTSSKERNPQ